MPKCVTKRMEQAVLRYIRERTPQKENGYCGSDSFIDSVSKLMVVINYDFSRINKKCLASVESVEWYGWNVADEEPKYSIAPQCLFTSIKDLTIEEVTDFLTTYGLPLIEEFKVSKKNGKELVSVEGRFVAHGTRGSVRIGFDPWFLWSNSMKDLISSGNFVVLKYGD